jgi:hypothetical protein
MSGRGQPMFIPSLQAGRPGFDSRQGQEVFLLLHSVEIESGVHPASYAMGIGGSFSRGKAAEA